MSAQPVPEAIERLELKLAYLEKANTELSDVVFRQQQQIDALQARFTRLLERMEELATPQRGWTAEEEIPPHY